MATFGTFTAGEVLTAAELNGAGAWQDYTPTWTQSATITKTVNWARYTQLNKLVIGSVKMTATGAGTSNNKILVGLPVASSANNFLVGSMMFDDDSFTPNTYLSVPAYYESSTTIGFFPYRELGVAPNDYLTTEDGSGRETGVRSGGRFGQNFTTGAGGSVTGLTVASGDIIYIQFSYEAA